MQYFWYKFETTADSSINYNKRENFTFSCSANLVASAKYAAIKRKSLNLTNANCSTNSTWVTSNRPKWRLNCCPLKVANAKINWFSQENRNTVRSLLSISAMTWKPSKRSDCEANQLMFCTWGARPRQGRFKFSISGANYPNSKPYLVSLV